jgi:hypothetical protein
MPGRSFWLAPLVLALGLGACGGSHAGVDGGAGDGGGGDGGCAGCVDQAGACQPGTTSAACGAVGNACGVCGASATCTGGHCVAACDSSSCGGCCADGACVDGLADAACGAGGVACRACPVGSQCSAGTCVTLACAGSCAGCCDAAGACQAGTADPGCGLGGAACAACGRGRSCAAGSCVVDPSSSWDVVVVAATIPALDCTGASWDVFGGLPDPFVTVDVSDGTTQLEGATITIDDTLDPVYGQTVLTGVPAALLTTSLQLRADDYDSLSANDFIGGCAAPTDGSLFDGAVHSLTCPDACSAATPSAPVAFRYQLVPSP